MECQSDIQLLEEVEYLRLVQLWEEIAVSLRYIALERINIGNSDKGVIDK